MLCQSWPVKIAALQDPQHKTLAEPPGDTGGKPGCGGAVFLVGTGAEDFMHRAERQSAARQGAVERLDLKRQRPMSQRARPLDPADTVLQGDKLGDR